MIEVVLPNGQKVRVDTTDPEVAAEYGRKFFESDAAALEIVAPCFYQSGNC